MKKNLAVMTAVLMNGGSGGLRRKRGSGDHGGARG